MKNIIKDSHDPLYKQIAHSIIADIRKGEIPAGGMLPSISDLKEKFPAGRVTIVNALKKLVRDGFAVAKHGKGFFATSMGEKNLLGVVLPMHSPSYIQIYSGLIAGIDNAAKKAGHRILIMSSDEDTDRFNDVVDEMILSKGVRWLIAVPPMNGKESNLKFLSRKKEDGISLAVVDRRFPEKFLQFRQDRIHGLSLLVDRAADKKAQNILVFLGDKNERAMRLLKAMACEKGVKNVSFSVHKNPVKDLEHIKSLAPDAVLCENDFHARGILDYICEKPGFLISGYGATPTAVDIFPRLTTVNPGFASAGSMAFEHLSGKNPCDNNIINLKPYISDGETL